MGSRNAKGKSAGPVLDAVPKRRKGVSERQPVRGKRKQIRATQAVSSTLRTKLSLNPGAIYAHGLTQERNWVAIDTETTGLRAAHGDRPFMVTTWSTEHNPKPYPSPFSPEKTLPGVSRCYRGKVNPKDRSVEWDPAQLDALCDHLQGKSLVFFNAQFDLRMLAEIGVYFVFSHPKFSTIPPGIDPEVSRIVHCPFLVEVQALRHVVDNRGPKELKPAAHYYCGVPDDDERELGDFLTRARNRARTQGWALGREANGKSAPKADLWIADVLQEPMRKALLPKAHTKAATKTLRYIPEIDPLWGTLCEKYGRLDTYRTLCLFLQLLPPNDSAHEHHFRSLLRQMRVLPPLYWMTHGGLGLVTENLESKITSLQDKIDRLNAKASSLMVLPPKHKNTREQPNPGSGPQLAYNLFELGKAPILKKTATGRPSTDKESIAYVVEHGQGDAQRLAKVIATRSVYETALGYAVSYRNAKTSSALLHGPNAEEHYRADGSYNQTGTALTRFSSSSPNLQNIKKDEDADDATNPAGTLRTCFGPSPGFVLISIDYSQLELRLFARAARDLKMLQAFEDGVDYHANTAAAVFKVPLEEVTDKQRKKAKIMNFAMNYGAGRSKLDAMAGVKNAMANFAKVFPNAIAHLHRCSQQAEEDNYIETLFGYRLWVAPEPPYVAVNMQVQGTAGEVVKEAMIDLYYGCPYEPQPLVDQRHCYMVANVHDELLFEISLKDPMGWQTRARRIARVMEAQADKIQDPQVQPFRLPVEIDVHRKSWGQKKVLPHKSYRTTFDRLATSKR